MSQKPVYPNMAFTPETLYQYLTSKPQPQDPVFTSVQQAQAPQARSYSMQELMGEPGPISANDPFFANAASPQYIEDMDVNHYRQLLNELMKQGFFQGGENMLTDNNALLANRTLLDLAGNTVPLINDNKAAAQTVERMFPGQAFANDQMQALAKWKLQKEHEARVKQMQGNKLIAGQ